MINYLAKPLAYLSTLLILGCSVAQATESKAWYYNGKLSSPADSRAVLKNHQNPALYRQTLVDQPIFKHWIWLKQHPKQTSLIKIQRSYLAPKSQQGRALPFWPDLQPK